MIDTQVDTAGFNRKRVRITWLGIRAPVFSKNLRCVWATLLLAQLKECGRTESKGHTEREQKNLGVTPRQGRNANSVFSPWTGSGRWMDIRGKNAISMDKRCLTSSNKQGVYLINFNGWSRISLWRYTMTMSFHGNSKLQLAVKQFQATF